jgi:hypothetical protein
MRAASMRCDKLIQIRAPEALAQALTTAADKRLTSRSDYIRAALLNQLRADDIELVPFAAPASNSYEFP